MIIIMKKTVHPQGSYPNGLSVRFNNVSFGFDPSTAATNPVLDRISFSVPAGRSLAIVGGSGKNRMAGVGGDMHL